MFTLLRKFSICLLAFALVVGAIACGGASNNDQGTSFLSLGYYNLDESDKIVGVAFVNANISSDRATLADANTASDGRMVSVMLGMENRLRKQFLRVIRIDCSYDVQGADAGLSIPDDSVSIGFVLGATENDSQPLDGNQAIVDEAGSVSQNTDITRPQIVYYAFPVVSTDIFAFLNNNINRLPQLPFTMTATCYGVGITEAGDVLETNPVSLPVIFSDQAECCTGTGTDGGGGFQNGVGTGGEFNSFDNSNVLTGAATIEGS